MPSRLLLLCAVCAFVLIDAWPSLAGAPFLTDDPGTPDRGHFEVDLAARYLAQRGAQSGTLPYLEVDYGLTSHIAVHVLGANAMFRRDGAPWHVGYGDTELGVKARFLDQDESGSPLGAAIYPIFLAATGDEARGLGNGRSRWSLPLWLAREEGPWKIFGGLGYSINPGAGNRDFVFLGLGVLRRLDDAWSVGTELFHQTADTAGGHGSTGFNVGATYDFSAEHHVLVSVGRGLRNVMTNQLSLFFGYQLTP
jgi:hypothetical protein